MIRRLFFAAAMTAPLACNLAAAAPAHAQTPSAPPAFTPTRFTVIVEGTGPDVIMIPGLTSSRRVWDQAVAGLGGHYRVHRIQVAGFGGAPAGANAQGPVLDPLIAEIHAYIAASRLDRPMLVGHSVGGLVALKLAAAHPGDVRRAMIVDALPFYGMLFAPDATVESVAPRAAAFRDMIAATSDEAWRAQQAGAIASLAANEAARPALIEDSIASDRRVVARVMYEDVVADIRPTLPAMQTPLTILYAVNPYATEARFGALMRAGYAGAPHATLVPVEPSYHFIMLDQPARFQALLDAFLADRNGG